MLAGIKPTVDYVFKRLFGSEPHKELLAHLLNAVVQPPEGKRAREMTLRNPFSEREYAQDKASILDVKATDQANRHYHVEMQWHVPWSFDKRLLYYWARSHSQQLFEGDFYETLCPTYSICFLNETLFPDADCHHKFQLWDAERRLVLSKDLEIHLIELPKFQRAADECGTLLDKWCYFLKNGESLDSGQLPATLDIPPIRQALEVLIVMNQNDLERQRYEDRLKLQRDTASAAHFARTATERGLKQGREEGELIGRIHSYQELLRQPLSPAEVLFQLSPDELAERAEQLKQQLLSRINGTREVPPAATE